MTCIVGVIDKGNVWIGGDRCVSTEYDQRSLKHPKIHTLKIPIEEGSPEQMLVGSCGDLRFLQIVKHGFQPPTFDPKKHTSLMEYLVVDFCDSLKEVLEEKGLLLKKDADEDRSAYTIGEMLIGFRGELFVVCENFGIISITEPEFCVGSGESWATGHLRCSRDLKGKEKWSVEKRITEALKCAAEYNLQTQGPFDILNI